MENEFNSNRPTDPAHNQSAKRPGGEHSGRNFPPVRPGQVERARALIAEATYPPDDLLNRIANLLAGHLKQIHMIAFVAGALPFASG